MPVDSRLPVTTLARFGLCLALLLAGCGSDDADRAAGGASAPPSGDGQPEAPGESSPSACIVDEDCEPVASSCCECPTFAAPVADGFTMVCEDVSCDVEPAACPALQAICSPSGQCELACAPVSCDTSCTAGFAVDEAGCLTCACAVSAEIAECEADEDCTQVAADCCGCQRGGSDRAIPAADAADYVDSLGCTGTELCPEVDVCDDSAVPLCLYGRCGLMNPALADSTATICGTADSPTCPGGSLCVLNSPEHPEVTAAGLGVCVPEP